MGPVVGVTLTIGPIGVVLVFLLCASQVDCSRRMWLDHRWFDLVWANHARSLLSGGLVSSGRSEQFTPQSSTLVADLRPPDYVSMDLTARLVERRSSC